LPMQHLREFSLARYGGHFCPFRAKSREISQHIPTEFQIFASLPQKFGAVTSKCDSPFLIKTENQNEMGCRDSTYSFAMRISSSLTGSSKSQNGLSMADFPVSRRYQSRASAYRPSP